MSVFTTGVLAQAGDPTILDGIDWGDGAIIVVKVLVAFAALLVAVMLMIWWERKLISDMQNRIGPSKAGPFGLLQTLADGTKLFFKEDLIPEQSDKFVFKLAPYLSLVPAFLTFAVVPVAGDFNGDDADGAVTIFGRETFLQVADVPMGVLFVLAMSSIGVYGIMLAGWSSGSKYPLLGSVRASAQMVSYEAALGLALAAILLKTGTLSTHGIVMAQSENIWDWGIVLTWFIPFFIFLIAVTAELNRPPFDLVEAEQEIVGGFHTEYSSIKFALFFLAEFMNTITMSAIMITLFFGGPSGPFEIPFVWGWLGGFIWFFVKLFLFVSLFISFRATLPRLRYDQLMDLGWKVLIPLALGWLLFLAAIDIHSGNFGKRLLVAVICIGVALVAAGLLAGAVRSGRKKRLEQEAFG